MYPLPGIVWLICSTASVTVWVLDQQVSEALQQEAKDQAAAAEARAAALQVPPYTLHVPPPPSSPPLPSPVPLLDVFACLGPKQSPHIYLCTMITVS